MALPLEHVHNLPGLVGDIVIKGKTKLLTAETREIAELLREHGPALREAGLVSTVPPARPPGGSLFVIDKEACPGFRADGWNFWEKKSDGTVIETHQPLKYDVIVYYAYEDGVKPGTHVPLHRRAYWLGHPQQGNKLVLLHYIHNAKKVRQPAQKQAGTPKKQIKTAKADASEAAPHGQSTPRRRRKADSGDEAGPSSAAKRARTNHAAYGVAAQHAQQANEDEQEEEEVQVMEEDEQRVQEEDEEDWELQGEKGEGSGPWLHTQEEEGEEEDEDQILLPLSSQPSFNPRAAPLREQHVESQTAVQRGWQQQPQPPPPTSVVQGSVVPGGGSPDLIQENLKGLDASWSRRKDVVGDWLAERALEHGPDMDFERALRVFPDRPIEPSATVWQRGIRQVQAALAWLAPARAPLPAPAPAPAPAPGEERAKGPAPAARNAWQRALSRTRSLQAGGPAVGGTAGEGTSGERRTPRSRWQLGIGTVRAALAMLPAVRANSEPRNG